MLLMQTISISDNIMPKEQSLPSKRKLLKSAGLRMTSQRTLILDIISQGKEHLDADEVYRLARERQSNLSLSTVYRNLQLLKRLGLIEELHFDQSHHHYEAKPSVEHHHLVCLGCGKVVEFGCELSRRMRQKIARKKGFEVTGVEVHMTGYCASCHRKTK
jgi:Fur family ferric uptake transcriptional regulator